jgi:tetratricopeptide (TPR) repeat protein
MRSSLLLASALLLGLSFVAALPAAHAQDARAEARARELRAAARALVEAGRIEEAFEPLREAVDLTADATVLLELAEVADRLRLDPVALEAYEAYLARRPDAPDRAAIEGRARILRELRAGERFVLDGNRASRTRNGTLVDWNGQPVAVRRPTGILTLTDWDGNVRTAPPPEERRPELAPFPGTRDLARRLSRP